MHAAIYRHNEDEVLYTVDFFKNKSESEISSVRRHLFCPECGGAAFYRRKSIDGKAACFGSRNHAENCSNRNLTTSAQQIERDSKDVSDILEIREEITVSFDAPLFRVGGGSLSEPAKKNTGKSYAIKRSDVVNLRGAKENVLNGSCVGINKVFNNLVCNGGIRDSNAWVSLGDKYRWRAKNLFVNFSDAVPDKSPKIFWGTISYADKDMNWLNPIENKLLGIPIERFRKDVLDTYAIDSRYDFEGMGIILFGVCGLNNEKTRLIVKPWNNDISRFFLINPA